MPEIEVPPPRFARNAPLDTDWPLVEATSLPHPPVVTPGGQSEPAGEWVASGAQPGHPAAGDEPARLVRSPADNQLHVVPRTEVLAAVLVNYARALCGRRIEGEPTVAVGGSGGGFCISCITAGTGTVR